MSRNPNSIVKESCFAYAKPTLIKNPDPFLYVNVWANNCYTGYQDS